MNRFGKALNLAREEAVLFMLVTAILLFLSAVGIYYFEHQAQPDNFKSIPHSLWWAVATLTTVGYGDVYPITAGGRVFTFVILMIGLGIVAVPAGLVAAALSQIRDDEENEI
jgi:voltage-gated potassium channel